MILCQQETSLPIRQRVGEKAVMLSLHYSTRLCRAGRALPMQPVTMAPKLLLQPFSVSTTNQPSPEGSTA